MACNFKFSYYLEILLNNRARTLENESTQCYFVVHVAYLKGIASQFNFNVSILVRFNKYNLIESV